MAKVKKQGQKSNKRLITKWSDQAWLMSNSKYWVNPDSYFTGLNCEFDSKLKLNKTAVDAFLELEGKEITLLQPYFKLDKYKNGKFRNYPFTTLQRDIDKVAEAKGKVEFIALQSVEVRRGERKIGEKNIEFTLNFHASSYQAFTKPRGNNKIALIDFIRRVSGTDAAKKESQRDPHITLTQDHTARITVGLASPTGKSLNNLTRDGFISNGNLKQFASGNRRQMRLIGTLLEHNVVLNSDGSVDITISFLGMIDTFFENPSMNILFNTSGGNIYKKKLEKLQKNIKSTKEKKRRTALQKELETAKKSYATIAYKEILDNLKKRNVVLQTTVAADIVNKVINRKTAAQLEKEDKNLRRRPTDRELATNSDRAIAVNLGTFAAMYRKVVFVAPPIATAPMSQYKETPAVVTTDAAGAPAVSFEKVSDKVFTTRTINFIPMGAIIDYFVSNAFNKIVDDDGRFLGQIPNVTIGNIRFSRVEGSQARSIRSISEQGGRFSDISTVIYESNIGAIPVTLETFQKWFVKFIAGQNKVTISLRQFLMTLLQNLIAESFDGFGEASFAPKPWNATMNYFSFNKGTSIQLSALNRGTTINDYPIFKMGGRQSVVKDISFSKANVSKHFGAAQLGKSAFSETGIVRYPTDVTIEMLGNPFFQNGQLIIVDPTGFIDNTLDGGQLGIGGAYRIISTEMSWRPDGYSTTIKAVFESAYRNPFRGGTGLKKAVKRLNSRQLSSFKAFNGSNYIDARDINKTKYKGQSIPGSPLTTSSPTASPRRASPQGNSVQAQLGSIGVFGGSRR